MTMEYNKFEKDLLFFIIDKFPKDEKTEEIIDIITKFVDVVSEFRNKGDNAKIQESIKANYKQFLTHAKTLREVYIVLDLETSGSKILRLSKIYNNISDYKLINDGNFKIGESLICTGDLNSLNLLDTPLMNDTYSVYELPRHPSLRKMIVINDRTCEMSDWVSMDLFSPNV